jgi:DNA-binding transcriptional regulator YdaS (Cro superfamily)
MKPHEMKSLLSGLDLNQANFARLIGVTPRAVNLWMMDERAIPGPAASYLRLLSVLPMSLRQIEIARINERGTAMRDGMFGITFQGRQGAGMGMLVFDAGRIYGTDTEAAKYDGEYVFNESTGRADVVIKVSFPPNVMSVLGISNPFEWAIDVSTSLDPRQDAGSLAVRTSLGQQINAQYKYLRPLPDAPAER